MPTHTSAFVTSQPNFRKVAAVYKGKTTEDGAGVELRRIIGTSEINYFDPFLLFDVFNSDDPNTYIGGFPSHPHRGFETATYLFAGRMRHSDNNGHEGVIEAGGVQWMRAGRGIIHSEMPEQKDGLLSGVQLWINLPKSMKMSAPSYQEYSSDEIPIETHAGDSVVRVIAGRSQSDTLGPIKNIPTQPLFLDIELAAGNSFIESVAQIHAVLIYVHQGSIRINGESSDTETIVDSGSLATLSDGQTVQVSAVEKSRFLFVAALKLHEPIVRAGPFVMNTSTELKQALLDYESGAF